MEGLKTYGKYYEVNFDDIFQIKIDLNKNNRNEYILMNLLNTGGSINPLDCTLLYSNRSTMSNCDFGYHTKLTSFKKVTSFVANSKIKIQNADDSVDEYIYDIPSDKYVNKEKHLTATAPVVAYGSKANVALVSQDGAELDLIQGNNYPELISKGSKKTTFETSDSISEISNGVEDKLIFTKTGGLVTKISWLKNNTEIYQVTLTYTGSNISCITLNRVTTSGIIMLKSYTITFNNGISIINNVTDEKLSIDATASNLTTITRTRGNISLIETISYDNQETIVNDALGLKTYYVYDSNDRIVNVIDSSKRVIYTKYDGYKLLEQSKPLNISELTTKSLLTNGFFTNGLNGWNSSYGSCTVVNNNTSSNKFYSKMVRIPQATYFYQNISLEGTSLDTITLLFVYSNHEEYNDFDLEAYIGLTPTEEGGEFVSKKVRYTSDILNYSRYKFAMISVKPKVSYKSIQVRFYSYGGSSYIAGVQCLKSNAVAYMSYDSNDTIYRIVSGNQESDINVNDEGKVESGVVGDTIIDRKETNEKTITYKDYGIIETITKDTYEREIKKEINSQNEKYKSTKNYSNDELLSETNMAVGSTYTYDNREKLLTNVVNSEGHNTSYSYNSKALLNYMSQGSRSVTYSYTSDDQLDTYNLFDNDYVDGQVSKIKLNGNELVSFSYDDKGRIISESSNGETITYTYQEDKVSRVNKNGKVISYSYDANDKLTSVSFDNKTTLYQYDKDDNVILEQKGNDKIEKSFNDKGEIEGLISNVSDKLILKNIDLVSKKQGKTFASVKRDIYKYPSKLSDGTIKYRTFGCFFDKEEQDLINITPNEDKKETTTLLPSQYKTTISRQSDDYNKVNVGSTNSTSKLLVYDTNLQTNSDNFTFAITFDYYKYSAYDTGTLMYIGSKNYTKGSLSLKVSQKTDGNYLRLYACSSNGFYMLSDSINYLAFEVKIPDNGWNKVGISMKQTKRSDGKYSVNIIFMVNDTILTENRVFQDKFELFGTTNHLCFGGILTSGTVKENVYSGIASLTLTDLEETNAIMMSKEELQQLLAFKERGRKFDSKIQGQAYYQSKAEIRKLTSSLNDDYDFFPLSGTFNSIKGTKPYVLDHKEEAVDDPKYFFIFNKDTMQYEYEAKGQLLRYKLSNSTGGFSLDVNVQNNGKHQTIFALKTNNKVYEVYYQSGYIKYRMSNGINSSNEYTYVSTTGFLTTYGKHTFALTYSSSAFNIFVDGVLKSSFNVSGITTPIELLIGRDEENHYPLEGNISNLIICNKDLGTNINELTSLKNKIVVNHLFDKFGRIDGENVVNLSGTKVYDKSIGYKTYNGYNSNHISGETISNHNFNDTFIYSFVNSSNKVTSLIQSIQQTINGSSSTTSYYYDENNRLIKEITNGLTTNYNYDNRGNILSNKEHNFTYSSTYLDRLETIDGVAVSYDSNIPYRMLSFGSSNSGLTFTYLGKEITSITNKQTGVSINCTYDELGRRITKGNKSYVYLDGKLETEYTTSYTLRFLYDENDNLFGFYYNETPYFYLKNALGIIYAIVDSNGEKVVEYSYDAWGNLLNKEVLNTSIGSINPFIYKSYYYDKETGLAMVGQRYYSPELCRFIQPADISNLNPHSINGLNLYAYANNNPIGISKSTNRSHATLHNGSMMTHIIPSLNKFTSGTSASSKNYWNPHWENKWFDTDWPGFFVLSQEGFEVVNWSLSIYKGSLYFDNNENHSLYISAGNIGVYAGINYKEGIGIDAGASVLEIGYDGRIIDASIEGLTIGITYMYKDGKFEFGYGAGWFGWSVSIDFVELFKLLFGGE